MLPPGHFPLRLFLLSSVMIVSVSSFAVNHDAILEFMYSNGISYDDLHKYFNAKLGLDEEDKGITYPRLFPLCDSSSKVRNMTGMETFADVLEKMETSYDCGKRALPFYAFDKEKHMALAEENQKNWIEKIEIKRIYSPDADVRNLRQWMQLRVKTNATVTALYIQSVVGPLGLPSGIFSLEPDLPCGPTKAEVENSAIVYCDYRSKADINHPMVYFGKEQSDTNKNEYAVNYKWHDISCMESPYLQFILIPIKAMDDSKHAIMGKDYQPLLSPVYTNFEFDSNDGLISPYYIEWSNKGIYKENYDCAIPKTFAKSKPGILYHDSDPTPLKWSPNDGMSILPFNEDYENCILLNPKLKHTSRNDIRRECSPGPFECPESEGLASKTFDTIVKERKEKFDNTFKEMNCLPCFLPSREEMGVRGICDRPSSGSEHRKNALRKYQGTPEYIDFSELMNSPNDVRYHGSLSILTFLFIIPLANFVGRFYRETVLITKWTSYADFWILLHGFLHLIGWLLTWISLGKVTSGYDGLAQTANKCFEEAINHELDVSEEEQEKILTDLEECIVNNIGSDWHIGLGACAVIGHQALVASGIFRSHKPHIRNIEISLHSYAGYGVYLFAVLAVLVSNETCIDLIFWTLLSFLTTCGAYAVATLYTMKEDRKIGVKPKRYHFPILEHIQLLDRSPIHRKKIVLLGGYIGLLGLFWVLSYFSFSIMSGSEIMVLGFGDDLNQTKHIGHSVQGLFAECRRPVTIRWENIADSE